jgi:hypothetical protein
MSGNGIITNFALVNASVDELTQGLVDYDLTDLVKVTTLSAT